MFSAFNTHSSFFQVFLILPIICSDCLQQPVAQKHWVYKATTNTLHFIVKQLRAVGMVRGHVLHLYTKYESMNQYFWSFREIVGYYAPIWGTLSNAAIRPPLCLSVCPVGVTSPREQTTKTTLTGSVINSYTHTHNGLTQLHGDWRNHAHEATLPYWGRRPPSHVDLPCWSGAPRPPPNSPMPLSQNGAF